MGRTMPPDLVLMPPGWESWYYPQMNLLLVVELSSLVGQARPVSGNSSTEYPSGGGNPIPPPTNKKKHG